MKKIITLMFAITVIALVSCNNTEIKTTTLTDSLTTKIDTSATSDTILKADTCKKIETPVKKTTPSVKK